MLYLHNYLSLYLWFCMWVHASVCMNNSRQAMQSAEASAPDRGWNIHASLAGRGLMRDHRRPGERVETEKLTEGVFPCRLYGWSLTIRHVHTFYFCWFYSRHSIRDWFPDGTWISNKARKSHSGRPKNWAQRSFVNDEQTAKKKKKVKK